MRVGCAWHIILADAGVATPCCVGRLGVVWFERRGVLVARYLHLQCWGGLDLLPHSGLVSLSFISSGVLPCGGAVPLWVHLV